MAMIGRGCWQTAQVTIFLIIALLPSAIFSLSPGTLFGTDDYALVGVANCSITVQTKVDDNVCAYHLSDQPRSFSATCPEHFTVLLVPTENDSTTPPRLLTVFKVNEYTNSLVYSVTKLELPSVTNELHSLSIPIEFNKFSFFNNIHSKAVRTLTGVTYDHIAAQLYIFHEADSHVYVDVYMLRINEISAEPTNVHLYQFEANQYFYGVQWSSDPYTQQFFYHKREFNKESGRMVSRIYSLPFNAFVRHLTAGTPGTIEKDFAFDSSHVFLRKHVQISNGIIYSTSDDHMTTGRHRYLSSYVRTIPGWRCPYFKPRKQDFFFVLTGWNLCKLQNENNASRTACNLADPVLRDVTPLADELEQPSNSSGFLWAITVAVIINAVILLVILCVVCRRKEMDIQDKGYYAAGHSVRALLTPEEVFQQRRTTSSATDF